MTLRMDFLGEFSDCHELLFEIFRIHGDFELCDVRRGLRFEVFDPQFVYAGLKYDGIDIVYELTFVIRIHHQNREFRSVGSSQMRKDVGLWRKTCTFQIHMTMVQNFGRRNSDLRFLLSKQNCAEENTQNRNGYCSHVIHDSSKKMDQGLKTLVHLIHCRGLRPGIPRFSKRQGADPNAGRGVDRIDDRRRSRWKRRLAQTGRRVVGF